MSPTEIAAVYRRLASADFLESVAIADESPIGDIAHSIVRTALIGTPTLLNALKDDEDAPLTEEVIGQYSFEQLLFSLHMLGRLAFLDSTLSERRAFMDQLVESVFETLAVSLADAVDLARFAQYFASSYNARQDEYSKYQESWSRGESAKNTLLWEYGKRIVGLVSARKNDLKIAIVGNLAMQYIYDLMPFVRSAATGQSRPTE